MVAPQTAASLLHGLFKAHGILCQLKVALPLVRWPLGEVDTPGGNPVVLLCLWRMHLAGHLVVISQIFVNVIGRHLSGRDGADDCGGACHAVAAGKQAGDRRDSAVQLCQHTAA